ncbi:hypothetical protein HaLaN_30380, partial [Haematococcus lacustris]
MPCTFAVPHADLAPFDRGGHSRIPPRPAAPCVWRQLPQIRQHIWAVCFVSPLHVGPPSGPQPTVMQLGVSVTVEVLETPVGRPYDEWLPYVVVHHQQRLRSLVA